MSVDLYTKHFGFTERPFTLLPDPDFLFWSADHTRAYAVLEYGITVRSPLTVITGEVGAGKTTLVQQLLASMDGDVTVGLISNAQGGRGDLLRWVLYALGVDPVSSDDYVSMFHQFQDFVIAEYAQGRNVVLVIDEAQNLSMEALEELRMFTNINANKDELLQVILVGQPELRETIEAPRLSQFAQRVMATYHLTGLDAKNTADYIAHRLIHAGGTGREISSYAVRSIFAQSRGVPRLINKLCELALVYAAGANEQVVSANTVQELIRDGIFVVTKTVTPPSNVLRLENPILPASNKAAE